MPRCKDSVEDIFYKKGLVTGFIAGLVVAGVFGVLFY
jgi:tetrahydromethanopterin S-methyltransferase subunit F